VPGMRSSLTLRHLARFVVPATEELNTLCNLAIIVFLDVDCRVQEQI
jgi:hypothetical protein